MARSEPFRPTAKVTPVNCPPVDERPYIRAFNTPARGIYHAVCLHEKVLGFITHHIDGRTVPCLRSPTFCRGCREYLAERWEGYIGIALATNRSVWLAKVTASGYRYSPSLMQFDGNLYGRRISFARLHECKNGPLRLVVTDPVDHAKLPRAFDLVGALSRRWNMDLSHLRSVMETRTDSGPPVGLESEEEAI